MRDVLRSGWLTRGPAVEAFERAAAAYLEVPEAIAVSSGTAALHLALLALGIGADDEVLVADFTFPAPANVVRQCGAVPVMIDIDPDTMNMSPKALETFLAESTESAQGGLRHRRSGRRIRALVPVHLFGLPAEMDTILALAQQYGLQVIEDAACAFGARYGGHPCGTLGNIGCFSFHPRKIITTGEGGVVIAREPGVLDQIKRLRNHGLAELDGRTVCLISGLNYRMSDLQAAVGLAQLRKLPSILQALDRVAGWYRQALAGTGAIQVPVVAAGRVFQAFVVRLTPEVNRDAVIGCMREAGIECAIGTYAVSAQPAHAAAGCPHSQQAQRTSLALPFYAGLDRETVHGICDVLKTVIGGHA